MNSRNLIMFGIVLLMVITGGACESQAQGTGGGTSLEASGIIEARQVSIAPEIGSRVVEVLVDEGQRVTLDQLLVRLDDASLVAQRDEARAARQATQAELDRLRAGPTAYQIQAAEAQLAQAEANLRTAKANRDALTRGTRPEIVTATREQLDRARTRYYDTQAVHTLDQIEGVLSALITAEGNLRVTRLRRDRLASESRHPAFAVAAAEAAVEDAQAAVDATGEAYDAVADESRPLYAQINKLHLCWELAEANLNQARVRRDTLADDERTSPDALDAAEATVEDAQDLVDAIGAAYDALASGTSTSELRAVWAEVRRGQVQLDASGSPLSTLAGAPHEVSAVVASRALSVRAGPGIDYQRVGAVGQGTEVVLNRRNEPETWVRGRIPEEDMTGWLSAANLDIDGDVTTLPVGDASFSDALAGFETSPTADTTLSVEALLNQVDAAAAARDMAEAKLLELKSGARPEEISAAEAKVAQAQARLDALQVQLDKMTLYAPVNGVVVNRSIQPGEIASSGATLLRLADLDQVKLTVYVPETQIGKVQLGQAARVSVDSFPDRTFQGEVTFIAQEAEFTPENVQTEEQRANLVFAVRVSLDNPGHLLKPGMPADATLIAD